MTDRELLELAAKAAEAEFESSDEDGIYLHQPIGGHSGFWDPLTDDGDALRLAVKLNIRTEQHWYPEWTVCYYNIDGDKGHSFRVEHAGDPYAATRRAIVKAASAIGKDMT